MYALKKKKKNDLSCNLERVCGYIFVYVRDPLLSFQDYKKPLEESSPPILSQSKITTLFHRLPEILQCHTLFRIALAECVRSWDKDEKLGDVFVASFSKAIVLDIYSGFINNFSVAMDLAKQESKRKTALADFFKVSNSDRNS